MSDINKRKVKGHNGNSSNSPLEFSTQSTDEWDLRSSHSDGSGSGNAKAAVFDSNQWPNNVTMASASAVAASSSSSSSSSSYSSSTPVDKLYKSENNDYYEKMSKNEINPIKTYAIPNTTWAIEFAFLLISFGYMLPWTSLGSLISYYKETFSANFYVKLYCAYYLPGLPVAYLQYKLDPYLDNRFGSANTYFFRGLLSYIAMIGILISLVWVRHQYMLMALFMCLGISGWLCHGTASMLASMYPSSAIAWLQTGFRCPEIYTVTAVAVLDIGKTATEYHLILFYCITSVVVSIGMMAWVFVVTTPSSKSYFESKDQRMTSTDDGEKRPLIDRMSGTKTLSNNATDVSRARSESKGQLNSDLDEEVGGESIAVKVTQSIRKSVSLILMRKQVYEEVLPLCVALIVTMWCSIFQASFFAYVDSPKGRDIEQILYFVRLFSDLLGRPLTRLKRPWFLRTNQSLLYASLARVLLMILFFVYLFSPSFPRSDIFISILVGLFSILSGYFTVLIYEYAAHDGLDQASQTYATQLLNICFQIAAFTSVLCSVLLTTSGWMDTWLTNRR